MSKGRGWIATLALAAGVFFSAVTAQPPAEPGNEAPGGPGGPMTAERMFERADTNKDGVLQASEFQGPEEMFKQLDKDSNGKLTKEEAAEIRSIFRGGGDRGNFQERRLEMLKTSLKATDEEWTVLKPLIQKVMDLSMQRFSGMGMRGFSGRRGGDGQNAGGGGERRGPEARPELPEVSTLRQSLDSEGTSAQTIEDQLKALREAREKQAKELEKARNELSEVVTVRQEAVLVLNGILE